MIERTQQGARTVFRARARSRYHPSPTWPPKILVVDDEPSMREMLGIMLRKEGFEVVAGGEPRRGRGRARAGARSTWSSPTSSCPTATASRSCATSRRPRRRRW